MKNLNWKTINLAGSKFIEGFLGDEKIFDGHVMEKKIQLYDLREIPAKIYAFADSKTMKKVCEKSLDKKEILADYLDKEWYDLSEKTSKSIKKVDELIKHLS